MALLQISEPGMSTAPHQHRLAVGIDLGTTNSLVATVRHGIPEVLNDEDGHSLLPSIVRYLSNGYANIGYKAKAAQIGRCGALRWFGAAAWVFFFAVLVDLVPSWVYLFFLPANLLDRRSSFVTGL